MVTPGMIVLPLHAREGVPVVLPEAGVVIGRCSRRLDLCEPLSLVPELL